MAGILWRIIRLLAYSEVRMPDEGKQDHIEKLLTDQKPLEHRRQTLIADLPKQKEAAIQELTTAREARLHRAQREAKKKPSQENGTRGATMRLGTGSNRRA